MIYDCIIVSTGAAGLFAGARFDMAATGLILEKTSRAGTKLLMSGGGQCNITHAGSIKDFIDRYGKKGGRIRSCLYKHNNLELMAFLEENGIPTVTQEEDGRVFPASRKAQDIRDLLVRKSQENGFEIAYGQEVTGICWIPAEEIGSGQAHSSSFNPARGAGYSTSDSDPGNSAPACWELTASKTTFRARTVILASGGCSYPKTGSDGQLFSVLQRDLDLEITPAAACTDTDPRPELSLRGTGGDLLCRLPDQTATGTKRSPKQTAVSCLPTGTFPVLPSSTFPRKREPGDTLVIDYLSAPQDETASRLQKAVEKSHAELPAILTNTFGLPKRFSHLLVSRIGHSTKALAAALTGDRFTITSLSSFEKAMVTSGGIDLAQIDLKTMALKHHPGLFVCGEMLDIDGSTGGYNLQFAYASGCTAAESALSTLSDGTCRTHP